MSKAKKIVAIPNTDTAKLTKALEQNSLYGRVHTLSFLDFKHSARKVDSSNSLGLVLANPAQRLIEAYNAIKATHPHKYPTFRDFYLDPSRINFYSNLLSGYEIKDFGFVGIKEHLHKSILVLSDWLGTRLSRLPHNIFGRHSKALNIDEQHLREIKEVYSEDFAIYMDAKKHFEKSWLVYQQKYEIYRGVEKKLKIHIGPPKTGTSAIQSWLHENRAILQQGGVLYPEHNADNNGVSSGNYEYLISKDKNTNASYFDDEKAISLINKFLSSNAHTLLLSSEHFYYYLIWLFSRFPRADYIFYIRHPLAITESGFHQEVKRHNRVTPFSIPKGLGFESLLFISFLAQEFGCNIVFRYFDKSLFEGGSLLSDFAASINADIPLPNKIKPLNTQYRPGAVQLMMKCNLFASQKLKVNLDSFLQRESEEIAAFSFVTQEAFEEVQRTLREQVELLLERRHSLDLSSIHAIINNYEKPSTCTTKQAEEDLVYILNKMSSTERSLTRQLYMETLNCGFDSEFPFLIKHLRINWLTKAWCKLLKRIE